MFKQKLIHLVGGGTLMLLCASSHGADYQCGSSAGTWSDNVGTWSISQNNSNGSLSGTFVNFGSNACSGGRTWAVTGTHNQDGGNFTYFATYVGLNRPEGCAQTVTLTGNIFKGGCNNSAGTFINSSNLMGTFELSTSCKVPGGETAPVFQEWGDASPGHNATAALFNQKLTPTGFNYSGRYVQESFNPSQSQDTCYFPGSEFDQVLTLPPKPKVSAGPRAPSGYSDYVGMGESMVTYYRSKNISPCGIYLKQQMRIDCNNNTMALYAVNDLRLEQEPRFVMSTRAGTYVERLWGTPPPKYRAIPAIINSILLQD